MEFEIRTMGNTEQEVKKGEVLQNGKKNKKMLVRQKLHTDPL